MALPSYATPVQRTYYYAYLFFCSIVFFFFFHLFFAFLLFYFAFFERFDGDTQSQLPKHSSNDFSEELISSQLRTHS